MSTTTPRPPYDPELAVFLTALPDGPPLSAQTLPAVRPYSSTPIEPLLEGRDVERTELTAPAADGHGIALTMLRPARRTEPTPVVVWIHGGGMVMGDRFSQLNLPLDWFDELGMTVITVEYRLAPEHPGSMPRDDCATALTWVAAHAEELGLDPERIVLAGVSGGGGLAAGVALHLRGDDSVPLRAQVLICPMLDSRNEATSAHQFADTGIWSARTNAFAWEQVLGDADAATVATLTPALAEHVAGLPPTYLDAGSAETFRDEVVAYASRLWAAGADADLHVWGGGFHGFDATVPDAALSLEARRTRTEWLRRRLA